MRYTSLSGFIMIRGIAAKWMIASIGLGFRSGLNSWRTSVLPSALNTWPATVRSMTTVRAAESRNGTRSRLSTLWPCSSRSWTTHFPAMPLPPVTMMFFAMIPPGTARSVAAAVATRGIEVRARDAIGSSLLPILASGRRPCAGAKERAAACQNGWLPTPSEVSRDRPVCFPDHPTLAGKPSGSDPAVFAAHAQRRQGFDRAGRDRVAV